MAAGEIGHSNCYLPPDGSHPLSDPVHHQYAQPEVHMGSLGLGNALAVAYGLCGDQSSLNQTTTHHQCLVQAQPINAAGNPLSSSSSSLPPFNSSFYVSSNNAAVLQLAAAAAANGGTRRVLIPTQQYLTPGMPGGTTGAVAYYRHPSSGQPFIIPSTTTGSGAINQLFQSSNSSDSSTFQQTPLSNNNNSNPMLFTGNGATLPINSTTTTNNNTLPDAYLTPISISRPSCQDVVASSSSSSSSLPPLNPALAASLPRLPPAMMYVNNNTAAAAANSNTSDIPTSLSDVLPLGCCSADPQSPPSAQQQQASSMMQVVAGGGCGLNSADSIIMSQPIAAATTATSSGGATPVHNSYCSDVNVDESMYEISEEETKEIDVKLFGNAEVMASRQWKYYVETNEWTRATCALMACLFSRDQMANSTVLGRGGSRRAKLPSNLVAYVVSTIRNRFKKPAAAIRARMAQKCKDERRFGRIAALGPDGLPDFTSLTPVAALTVKHSTGGSTSNYSRRRTSARRPTTKQQQQQQLDSTALPNYCYTSPGYQCQFDELPQSHLVLPDHHHHHSVLEQHHQQQQQHNQISIATSTYLSNVHPSTIHTAPTIATSVEELSGSDSTSPTGVNSAATAAHTLITTGQHLQPIIATELNDYDDCLDASLCSSSTSSCTAATGLSADHHQVQQQQHQLTSSSSA